MNRSLTLLVSAVAWFDEIPSINQMGEVPIERLALDNVALCEELIGAAN